MDLENGNQPTTLSNDGDSNVTTQTESGDQETQEVSNPNELLGNVIDAFNKDKLETSSGLSVPPTKTPIGTSQAAPTGDQPPGRSFEGLEPDEAKIFKHMSNEAYARLYPMLLEHKKLVEEHSKARADLEKLQGQSYFDHEEAYKLTPEYNGLVEAATRVDGELQYWQQQLAIVKSGGEFEDITFDPKTGQYTRYTPIKVGPENQAQIEAHLTTKIAQAQGIRMNLDNQLGQMQGKFKTDYQGYLSGLSNTEKQVFDGVDPKLMTKLEEASKSKLELFPSMMRGRPEVKIAAKLMIINDGLIQLLKEKTVQVTDKKIVNRIASNAGPTNVSGGAAVGANSVDAAMKAFHNAGFNH